MDHEPEETIPDQGNNGNLPEYELNSEDFESSRETALSVLENHDYLARDEQGRIIVDLNKFRQKFEPNAYLIQFKRQMGPLALKKEYGAKNWTSTLFHVFKDLQVYSSEDYAKLLAGEQVEPKPFLYSPKNSEAAFSIEDVKNSDFYMGLWELGENPKLPLNYPTLDEGNNSDLSTQEAIIMCLIFNKKYGDGQRKADGELSVNFNEEFIHGSAEIRDKTSIRRPISGTFFASWKYFGAPNLGRGPGEIKNLLFSPARFFLEKCPNIIDREIIDPYSDFAIKHEQNNLGSDIRGVGEKGLATLNGRTYSLGKEFAGNQVYRFSDRFAGILDANLNLVMAFELDTSPYSEEDLKRRTGSRRVVGKSNIHFIDPTQLDSSNEVDGILLSEFKDLLDFSKIAVREGKFNPLDLSIKEQVLATSIYGKYKDDDKFHEFMKNYGLNGVRAMMAVEEANINADLIFEIGECIDATKLFSDVSDIVSAVTQYSESIKNTLPEIEQKEADEIAHTIMSFISKLLLSFDPIIHDDPELKGKVDIADIVSCIRSFKSKAQDMYRNRYGMRIQDKDYESLLDVYKNNKNDQNIEALTINLLQKAWMRQLANEDKDAALRVQEVSDVFYSGHGELFVNASETTGDTNKEIRHFLNYLTEKESSGEPIEGVVLDMGCGDGERITKPMAEALSEQAQIVGIDRVLPATKPENNMSFVKGDFTHIPLADNSVNLVTAHWSVLNDMTLRSLQLESFAEIARVLKEGGEFYFDVPYLEGGEGSWENAAEEFHREHPEQPYGMIEADFPGERSKEFYIYPESELSALLKQAGFEVKKEEPWRTEAGKPRKVVVARLAKKITGHSIAT